MYMDSFAESFLPLSCNGVVASSKFSCERCLPARYEGESETLMSF